MSSVIPFRRSNKTDNTTEKPVGSVDVFPEENGSGMMMIDGCLPVQVMSGIIALLGTAGIAITYNTF